MEVRVPVAAQLRKMSYHAVAFSYSDGLLNGICQGSARELCIFTPTIFQLLLHQDMMHITPIQCTLYSYIYVMFRVLIIFQG